MLSGVRTSELRLAEWSHIDFEHAEWTIPTSNQKLTPKQLNDALPFVVPMTQEIIRLFKQLLDASVPHSKFVMSGVNDLTPMTDKVFGRALRRMFENKLLNLDYFTVHDLRRTMRSHLGALGIQERVAEACLNHSYGGQIMRTYDVNNLINERRKALEMWCDKVMRSLDQT